MIYTIDSTLYERTGFSRLLVSVEEERQTYRQTETERDTDREKLAML